MEESPATQNKMKTTETIPCLENIRNHARKHLDSLCDHLRSLEDDIRTTEAKIREANRQYELAQAELDEALENEA
jgi:chromosome segregation ATPase